MLMPNTEDSQFQYVEGQGRSTFAALLGEYQNLSDIAAAAPGVQLDQRYGTDERQRFDLFPPSGAAQGVMLYFHAGYWQSRDKSNFRFLSAAFQGRGFFVALVNYPLCPQVALSDIVDAARASVGGVRRHLSGLEMNGLPLVLAGHSAGAHLCAELALSGAVGDTSVDGICAISGIYDLQPLTATTLNTRLQLDSRSALAASPIFRVQQLAPPALWLVGESETPAFAWQTQSMHEAWASKGNWSESLVVLRADHFSILRQWADLEGPLHGCFTRWWSAVLDRCQN